MIKSEFKQGSEQWKADRSNRFTGSCVDSFMRTKLKDGTFSKDKRELQKIEMYATEKAWANFESDIKQQEYDAKEMVWGKTWEPVAALIYAEKMGYALESDDMLIDESLKDKPVMHRDMYYLHESLPFMVSPDGVIESLKKCVEFKCPATKNSYFQSRKVVDLSTLFEYSAKYAWQVIAEMYATDSYVCDFVPYSPLYLSPLDIHIATIHRDDDLINEMLDSLQNASEIYYKVYNENVTL